MQNIHLLGVQHVDRVNLRLTFLVVAVFGAITIVSYINELHKLVFGGGTNSTPFSGRSVEMGDLTESYTCPRCAKSIYGLST